MEKDPVSLLARYFEGHASPSEREAVERWRREDAGHERLFQQYRTLWEVPSQLARHEKNREQALAAVKREIPAFRRRRRVYLLRYAAAAALFIGLILSGFFLGRSFPGDTSLRQRDETVVFQHVTANSGMVTRLTLADGTEVTLFPGSELTFPLHFNAQERTVQLSGEGFFRITHDEKSPFIVRTDKLDVRVLGTVFDVRTGKDDNLFEAVLVEGRIALQKKEEGKEKRIATLQPNQHAVYDPQKKSLQVKEEEDLEKYIAWTQGRLVFDADSLRDVIRRLESWYNVKIVVKDPRLWDYQFTGKFAGESVEKVLKLLQYTSDFHFRVQQERIDKNGYYSKKVIELY